MCTKLYDEAEFQPLDPSQEPIFPPELIVRYFPFVVSYDDVVSAFLYYAMELLSFRH